MVVDIGGGTTEVAVLSLGGIVFARSVRVGGDKMDEGIVAYLRRHQNVLIGEATAERIKREIGSACLPDDGEGRTIEITGCDLTYGVPKVVVVNEREISESLLEPIGAIVDAIRLTLENITPELSGTSSLRRAFCSPAALQYLDKLDSVLREASGLPVSIAEDPMACVALGTDVRWKR